MSLLKYSGDIFSQTIAPVYEGRIDGIKTIEIDILGFHIWVWIDSRHVFPEIFKKFLFYHYFICPIYDSNKANLSKFVMENISQVSVNNKC